MSRKVSLTPPPQLTALAYSRAGLGLRALHLVMFVHSWAIAEGDLGRRITIEDYSEWWRDGSRRTAYRRLAEFRELFPEFGAKGSPSDLIRWKVRQPTPEAARAVAWRLAL